MVINGEGLSLSTDKEMVGSVKLIAVDLSAYFL